MEIKDLFPLDIEVSQEIIDNSDIHSSTNCIGANLLRSIVPEEYKDEVYWGFYAGSIDYISIRSDINMTRIKKPTVVKLELI